MFNNLNCHLQYAAVCLGLDVKDLLARDFSDVGVCNYYTTTDTYLQAPIVLLIRVSVKSLSDIVLPLDQGKIVTISKIYHKQ